MAYPATVIQIMIASPADVEAERAVIRKGILDWNDLHSERAQLVLLPVAWETHSAPQTGERAQALINRDLLANCDLLVAVFWTRLGTPTGREGSGTVEEIREHLRSEKQAMIYFSNAPVHPDVIDQAQYQAVVEFREECKLLGLVEMFGSASELSQKFPPQLTRVVYKHFGSKKPGATESDTRLPSRGPVLSREAKVLLKAASTDPAGHIVYVVTFGGPVLQVGEQNLIESPDSRSEAVWSGALQELLSLGLVKQRDRKGEVFTLTRQGYSLADSLP